MTAIFKATYDTGMCDGMTGEPIMAEYQFTLDKTCAADSTLWLLALQKALRHAEEYEMNLDTLEVIAI